MSETEDDFAGRVADASRLDPYPTFRNLAQLTGLPERDLVHYALVRWVSAGSEALLSVEPAALRDLVAARDREDWAAVAGIIDWLAAGLDEPRSEPGTHSQPEPRTHGQPEPDTDGQPGPRTHGQPEPGTHGQPEPCTGS